MLRPGIDPASLLDLSPERRAELLVEGALELEHAARLKLGAAPKLAQVDAGTRSLVEHLLEEIARLSAQLDTLAQAQEEARRSRETRLRLDPIREIPAERLAAVLTPPPEPLPGPYARDAAAPDLVGLGWYPPERAQSGTLRWSGAGRCATLILPALGGGRLRVTLALRAPYGQPLILADHDWFLDGEPLALRQVSGGSSDGVFEAEVTLPESGAHGRAVLLLHGLQWADPATGPRRDPRRLGLGLGWLRLERAEG